MKAFDRTENHPHYNPPDWTKGEPRAMAGSFHEFFVFLVDDMVDKMEQAFLFFQPGKPRKGSSNFLQGSCMLIFQVFFLPPLNRLFFAIPFCCNLYCIFQS